MQSSTNEKFSEDWKEIFNIVDETLFYPFFEKVFTLPHAIPSQLNLAESNKYIWW